MKRKTARLLLSSSLLTVMLILGTSFSAFAQTTDILVRDSSGKLCQYSYKDLRDSLMDDKALFNEFKTKKVIAYKDDKTGYVNFDYIKDIYMNIDKKSFNLNTVTENAQTTDIVTITENIQKRLMSTNGVVDGDLVLPTSTDSDLTVVDIY